MNISRFKSRDYSYVENELSEILGAARAKKPGVIVKAIIERSYLRQEELERACRIIAGSGADFISEATGFAGGEAGCNAENIRKIRAIVGDRIKIKAVHTFTGLDDVIRAIECGADRVSSADFVKFLDEAGDKYWEKRARYDDQR